MLEFAPYTKIRAYRRKGPHSERLQSKSPDGAESIGNGWEKKKTAGVLLITVLAYFSW